MRRRLLAFGSAAFVLACLAARPLAAQEQSRRGHPRFPEGESAGPRPAAEPRSQPAPAPAEAPAPATVGGSGNSEADRAVARGGRAVADDSSGASAPQRRGPREARPRVGTAVPRESVPRPDRGATVLVAPYVYGFYPWGFGGLGFDGYYGYGGYYDPAYGAYPGYGGYPYYGQGAYASRYDGSLHLKITPRGAQVYVDGYYAGVVDDFDGIFQRLRLDAGPHRIEVRAPGYEPLMLDVRIDPDRTTTFRGDLKPIQ